MRLGETPVPIPNTMVKTQEADGTMLETAWESRWVPDPLCKIPERVIDRTDMSQRAEEKSEACKDGCVNPFQQGIAVKTGFYQ